MHRSAWFTFVFVTVSACGTAQLAPSDGGAEASVPAKCETYDVPSGTDLTTPQVSFRNDVVPIFTQTCGFTSCHGSPASTRVFLGANTGTVDAPKIRQGIVGIASKALPTMPFVTASDPNKSFLQHKIDGDACKFKDECVGKDCGASMPENAPLIDVPLRDTIRRWTAQGAADN